MVHSRRGEDAKAGSSDSREEREARGSGQVMTWPNYQRSGPGTADAPGPATINAEDPTEIFP